MTKDEAIKIVQHFLNIAMEYSFNHHDYEDAKSICDARDMAIEALSAEPQIIRCKDCLHWKHSSIRPNYCDVWDWCNMADDFCSFAERRD